jgi:hypothetical protein
MGQLERAKIYELAGDGSKGDKKDANGIDVCFNPKEYSLDKSVKWEGEKAFSDAPQPEFTGPSPMTLSVTLQFDTYEEGVSVRDKWVRKIEKLAMMRVDLAKYKKPNAKQKKEASPPVILFVWGRFTFKGVIESLGQKYTMFLSDGTPVRSEVALKIRNVYTSAIDDDKSNTASGGGNRTYTTNEGDRIDAIAAKEMGDASRWPELAAANGIDDPSVLPKGKVLKIPD